MNENQHELSSDESRMSFLDHLQELRKHLIRGALCVLLVFGACLWFSTDLFNLIAGPIKKYLPANSSLVFTSLPDPFFIYLKVALIAALFISLPYILYELWKFIYPGLYLHERKAALPFVVSATLLFYLGAAFAYFLVFPAAFKFFLSYESPDLKPMLAIREYVNLVMLLMLAFGAVFETPVIIVFLGLLGLFSSDALRKGRRYFVVLSFILAAILTPTPDVINQAIMAVPMMLFYEVGIWILAAMEKRREAHSQDGEQDVE